MGSWPGRAFVDICPQRNFGRIEIPGHQTLVSHAAVARFIVRPASRIVDPLPGQHVRKGTQHHAARFNSPDFVQVADRRAQLQLQPFAIGIAGINHVWPIEPARPEAWIASRTLRDRVRLGPRQSSRRSVAEGEGPTPTPPTCDSRSATAFVQATRALAQFRIYRERSLRPLLEGADLFLFFGQRKR